MMTKTEMDKIASTLQDLQEHENDGRGISCVRSIISHLQYGDFMSALIIRKYDGDKTINYPEIEKYLTEVFGCRIHSKFDCQNWLCQS